MSIPLFDCRVDSTRLAALDPLWHSGALAAGPGVGALEARLSNRFNGRPVVATSDMTQALCLALRLVGVGPGDEVVTLALNCMSSNSAIAMVGATPVWVDVDPRTAVVDLGDLAACIGPKTRAVVIYHVAGYVGDLAALRQLCDDASLPLIEDANNALGARWNGQPAGIFGDQAILSFYPNRQLNGIEGGALVCRPENETRARRLRRFGIDTVRFRTPDGEIDPLLDVPEIGVSASLSHVNAVLALQGCEDLDERVDRNRQNVRDIREALSGIGDFQFIEEVEGAHSVFWVALVRSPRRDALMGRLKASGIQCSRLHHRNDRYSGFNAVSRDLPGTDVMEREMFALPAGWWLSQDDLARIVDVVGADAKGR
ncbi:DegT/DnrJ/EryC1/StrS family aminotransferase [Sphingomonas pseudosanguinis]|uniref:dTDP-4-amino-4,6-dideoxygalactose transaminase n=1 Tax=Sphingomonas pseudosanguinis TaxID=413712 RepID=A0A7W6ADX3_9SPHN|nr:DegT/DnrJ/EryC1/StrS family aminotransferase [Sphingomonas pseudosanguinis]MBB3880133.1 dTDP-4-amino-4,6-dideoxygalactose transaminase [Sphingomonas pseudosanguinis]MBN3538582.1 DegT/DnrJ/EryC1/StrS family aminotransferase [Sphingomonas pseudosanguinis]